MNVVRDNILKGAVILVALKIISEVVCFLCALTHVAVANVEGPVVRAERFPSQGFGAMTQGGSGGVIFVVSNLNDSGPGSLRDALSRGHRSIQFRTGGEITLKSRLYVEGAYITLDGFSAPRPH